MVQFHALGALRITEHGREVTIGGPRQRRLVAMLLIHRNDAVSVDRLADAVFAGEPTPAASTTLRSYVARLRRVLGDGDGGPRVLTQAPGYVLLLADDELDVERFEAALAEARRLRGIDDPTSSASVLRDALALWRGEPYAEFADEDWARPEAQRLAELRLVALEALFDAELACGRSTELISEIEALAGEHPLRESLRAQLMVALYRAGRQADALRAYRQHREAMVEELGIDPAPSLRELEERILTQDPSLLLEGSGGSALRGYRLGERLGTGQDGTVHTAHLPGVERDLVIRVVRPDLADSPEVVRSFEATAHRVASLRHPAIVPIHDYWREPGAAYLVMRRMPGGTVADRLARGTMTRPEVSALVRRIGGALSAAADAGIVHGRVTAGSVLFDESGRPTLSDFALVSGAGDPDGDVQDLALLVERCLPVVDDEVAAVLARARGPEDVPSMAELVELLEAALTGSRPADERAPNNPYKGLRAFDEADAADFFGRVGLVDAMVERLGRDDLQGRLLLVVGGSGTGKSSVVRAGLLPRVRRGDIDGSQEWFVTTMLPGATPFKELAASLRRVAVDDAPGLDEELADSEGGIDRVLRRLVPDHGQLLLVVDQLEELFTSAPERDQRSFLAGLMYAVSAPDSRLRVVGTLRADFYDRPLAVQPFGAAVNDATVTLPAMSPSELEAAIVEPARRAGRQVEGALVAELVSAAADEPAGLPALQFTLYELAEADAGDLTLGAYRELGGLDGAIASRAESLYLELDDDERAAVRRLFEQLVVVGPEGEPTRRRAVRSELARGDRTMDVLIDRWAEARLLSLDRHRQSRLPTVEPAHEALLREWPRLRRWIEEDREALLVLGHLREAAAGWVDLGRDPGALYRGARLQVALDTLDVETLAAQERELLDASRAAREAEEQETAVRLDRQARANRRLRAQLVVIAVALVVALVGGFVAVDQRRQADEERRVAFVRELAAAADASLADDPERSMLLALAAIDVTRSSGGTVRPEAVDALHQAVTASRIVLSVPELGGALDWSPDGRLFVTEGPEETGLVDIRDAETGESVRSFVGHDVDINDVAFSADGSLMATAGDDGALRVWDPHTGDEVRTVQGDDDEGVVWGASFSPDGSLVAASWFYEDVVRVVDVATGEEVLVLDGPPSWTTAFSPDGTQLLVAWFDEAPEVVDLATGAPVLTLVEQDVVRQARYSPDGRWIATASSAGVAVISDARTGEQRFTVGGHTAGVNGVAWSADGTRLATASDDGTARVHEVTPGGVRHLHAVAARDMRNGVQSVAFSPDADRIMTSDWGIASVKVWDVRDEGGGELGNVPSAPFTRGSGELLPGGREIIVADPDGGFSIWGAGTGERLRQHPATEAGGAELRRIAVSPDAAVLAASTGGSPVHLWDVETGSHRGAIRFDGDWAVDLAWSPDGERLAIAVADEDRPGGVVSIVDRSGRQLTRVEEDRHTWIRALAWSPDGSRLATTRIAPRDDPALMGYRVWDAETGDLLRHVGTQATAIAYDPTGRWIATTRQTEGGADVWDAETGEEVAQLRASAGFYTVAFDNEGRQVTTAGADGAVRLWDPETGIQQQVLRGHQRAVGSVYLSDDGTRLSSLDEGGMIRVWSLDLDELVSLARARLTRSLDDDECRQYLHLDRCPEA
jgi:WD40 repeat protein/DNA-binding SARP family transcriptional activator